MLLPIFPDEVWSIIISFLVRPTPAPRDCKHWFGLHQHDIASMMRVNSDQVVVADLAGLVRGIETGEELGSPVHVKVIKEGMKTKRNLLAYIRKMQLVNCPPGTEPTYLDILAASGRANWRRLGRSVKEQLGDMDEIDGALLRLISIDEAKVSILCMAKLWNPFPKLDRIISGGNGDEFWSYREPYLCLKDSERFSNRLNVTRQTPLALLVTSKAEHYCTYSPWGPYALPSHAPLYSLKGPISLKSVTVHLQKNSFRVRDTVSMMPPVISGVTNRWVLDHPHSKLGAFDVFIIEFTSMLAGHLIWKYTSEYNEAVKMGDGNDPDTKLEIYVFGNRLPTSGRKRDGSIPTRETYCDEDEYSFVGAQEQLEDELQHTEWKGRVKLKLAYLAPRCECCGHRVASPEPDE